MRSIYRLLFPISVTKTEPPSGESARPLFVKDSPKVASCFTTRPVRAEYSLTEVERSVSCQEPTKIGGLTWGDRTRCARKPSGRIEPDVRSAGGAIVDVALATGVVVQLPPPVLLNTATDTRRTVATL
jgi:hypothetical protein